MQTSATIILIMILIANGHILNTFLDLPVVKNLENISEYCVCVPYWQCKDDFSGLVDDGVDIVDVRYDGFEQNLSLTKLENVNDCTPPEKYTNVVSKQADYTKEMVIPKQKVLRSYEKAPPPCTGDFDVCCQVECGKAKNKNSLGDLSLRILGDKNEAQFAEFPWMLGILKDKHYQCGASLIHPQVAITAAHCVFEAGNYKVRAGEWNWEKQDEPIAHQDRYVQKVIIHPQYHPGSLRNDIALLILVTPYKLAENVGIICLPKQGSRFDGQSCVASGWGKNSFERGTYQTTLKKIELPIVPNLPCVKSLQQERLGPYFKLHHSFICAGGEFQKDTCKGDGGSPLVCSGSNAGKYEQVGIVSWGLTCGVRNTPGVYVNVALFRDWIDREMLEHNFDKNIYEH